MLFSGRLFTRTVRFALAVGAFLTSAGVASAAIDANISFAPATVYPTQSTSLTFTLQNSALSPETGVAFLNDLPANVFIATPAGIVSTCGGTVNTSNSATNGQITFSGGSIPAGNGTTSGSCSIKVNVYGSTKGTYVAQLAAGAVTGFNSGSPDSNSQSTQGTLAVFVQDMTVSKTTALNVSGTSSIQGYETTTMSITLTNPNPVAITNAAFTDDLAVYAPNLTAVAGSGASTCGGTVTIAPKSSGVSGYGTSSTVSLAGGTVPANGSCVVTFSVKPSRDPTLVYQSNATTNQIPAGGVTSSQGASNATAATHAINTRTGVQVATTFNGSTSAAINTNTTTTATLRYTFTNNNTTAVAGFNFSDALPAGSAGGALTVTSLGTNTCGGTLAGTGTGTLSVTGGTLPAAAANQTGFQVGTCYIEAVVTVSTTAANTYANSVPTGSMGGYSYSTTSATLTASPTVLAPLTVTKAVRRASGTWYQGDTALVDITIRNNSATDPVTNIDITDPLTSMGTSNGIRVGSSGVVANSCGGTPVVVVGASSFQLNDISLAAGATCLATVQIKAAADTMPSSGNITNTIPGSNITFDTPTGTGQTLSSAVTGTLAISPAIAIAKSFSPATVAANGISRLTITVTRRSSDRSGTSNINLTDTLPAGHTVAPVPNVANACGGTVAAAAGASTITLSGGAMPAFASGTSTSCTISVNVKSPAGVGVATNRITADVHGSPLNFSAKDTSQAAPYDQLENLTAATANLTRVSTFVTVNKEFLSVTIHGGAASRVRITITNLDSSAIALTGVSLTDLFSSSDIRLYSTVNPTFSSAPGFSGCTGGTFTGASGAKSITLSNASIAVGSVCYFEFNVTAYTGGNHINTIPVGAVASNEGVSNSSSASATLTVDRQVNVGKGFTPMVIGAGEPSVLQIDIYNTNMAPADETGATPSLQDTLPAGVTVVSAPTTNCVGATVSASGGVITLNGGTFQAANACQIFVTVTSATAGVYTNTIPINSLHTLSGASNPDPGTATLTVIARPTIAKVFQTTPIPVNGISRIRFTITNPNSAAVLPGGLTNAAFSDNFSNMALAAPLYVAGTCAGITHNGAVGASSITVSGLTIPAAGNCYVDVDVTSATAGLWNNTASGVSSDQNTTAGTASAVAQLRVLAPVTIAKAFAPNSAVNGNTVVLTFTLSNPNPVSVAINTPGFTDDFPFAGGQMVVASPTGVATTCGATVRNPGNTAAPVAGDIGIYVRGGTIPANGSCTVTVNVTAPAAGAYANTTSTLSTAAGTASAASATVTYAAANPRIGVAKSAGSPVMVAGGMFDVVYTIIVQNTGNVDLHGLQLADTLSAPGQLGSAFNSIRAGPAVSLTNTSGRATAPSVNAGYAGSGNMLSGADGLLAPGDRCTVTLTVRIDPNAAGAPTAFLNQATGSGLSPTNATVSDLSDKGTDPTANDSNATTGVATDVPISYLTLAKTASVADTNSNAAAGDAGDIITFTYTITNKGSVTISGVTPVDAGPVFGGTAGLGSLGAFTLSSGSTTLSPGAQAVFTATYVISPADSARAAGIANGVRNTATPTGKDPTNATIAPMPAGTAAATLAAFSKLALTKSYKLDDQNGNGTADVDEVIVYTYTIVNSGNTAVTNVNVSDTHEGAPVAAASFGQEQLVSEGVLGTPASRDDVASDGIWSLLQPGATITIEFQHTVTQAEVDAQ